jgi:hypothetical protein
MMHPHMAKLLADARINEMLVTAERYRLRQFARRQRHRATEEPTAEPGRRRTLCDAISRLMGEATAKENPMGKISPQTTNKHFDLAHRTSPSTAIGGRTDELNPQQSTTQRTGSMMHPHMAKLLADARIDEMLAPPRDTDYASSPAANDTERRRSRPQTTLRQTTRPHPCRPLDDVKRRR